MSYLCATNSCASRSSTSGCDARLQRGVLEEREQALEVFLLVILDEQVIVALGAAEILAEEQPAHVARQGRVIDGVLPVVFQPLREKEGRTPGRGMVRIGPQD